MLALIKLFRTNVWANLEPESGGACAYKGSEKSFMGDHVQLFREAMWNKFERLCREGVIGGFLGRVLRKEYG